MPYDRNADLPEDVRNVLPDAAQTIYRKAHNAAMKTYNGDESKAAAVAWAAVKNAGYSKSASGKWTLSQTGVDAMPSHQIFLNALTPHEVTCEATEDGKWLVKGLPLIRAGTWNDIEYSADDLRGMVKNFKQAQDEEGFVPGLWPQHNYDHDGNIVPQPAGNALGFYQDLYFDEDSQTALGDVEVFDEQTAHDMERARLRYISGEFWRDEETGLSTRGAAFVPDGAVKGMPWRMVINAADYSDVQTSNNPKREGGNKPMSTIKDNALKVLAFLTGSKEDEDPEVLAQKFAALEPDAPEDKPEPTTTPETDTSDMVNPTQVEMLQRRADAERKARESLEVRVKALQEQNAGILQVQRHDLAGHLVEEWCNKGWVSPASVDFATPLAQFCLAYDGKVEVLSEIGNVEHQRPIDILAELLRLTSPDVVTMSTRGMTWTGVADPNAEDTESQTKLGKDMAALVNQPSAPKAD